MKFTCYKDKILIKPIGADTIIKSSTSEMNPEKGEVVDWGEDVKFVKKGDIIHFLAYGCSTAMGEEAYYVVTDSPQVILGKESNE